MTRLDQSDREGVEYLGFDPSTSSLLTTHASNCANTPRRATPRGFEPLRARHIRLAGGPLNHSGKVSGGTAGASAPARRNQKRISKRKKQNKVHPARVERAISCV